MTRSSPRSTTPRRAWPNDGSSPPSSRGSRPTRRPRGTTPHWPTRRIRPWPRPSPERRRPHPRPVRTGDYAETGLQAENTDGLRFRASDAARERLGERLTAAIEHAHLLVYRPREASGDAIQALLDAGWSADGIVTLSQLIAFLSFQQRVVSGLRVLSEEIAA